MVSLHRTGLSTSPLLHGIALQAMIPFDEGELDYIASLDAAHDVALLKQELPALRVASLRILEVSTELLKRGAAAGL